MIDHPCPETRSRVLLIQGLPGSGKTTLARHIKERLNAVHINADWARTTITSHLGFKFEDRVKQATALGQMARLIQDNGQWVIVDFVCPLPQTRHAFMYHFLKRSDVFSVWMDTIKEGRFEDTNKMYKKPAEDAYDYRVLNYLDDDMFNRVADEIVTQVTAGHATFYIRYNTLSDGKSKQWRVIRALTGEETLCDSFDLRGHMVPAMTIEHDVRKWNVGVTGFGAFLTKEDGTVQFVLKY
jgi:adenylylsulfate kinase